MNLPFSFEALVEVQEIHDGDYSKYRGNNDYYENLKTSHILKKEVKVIKTSGIVLIRSEMSGTFIRA